MLPLNSNTLDALTKDFEQLRVLLIDEVSLIGSRMLYNIDKKLREIMHTPTRPFGNLDVIFCGDLCQAKPVRDSWIFEQPRFQQQPFPSNFWPYMIKFYELKTMARQKKTKHSYPS